MKKTSILLLLIAFAASLQLGMAHRGQYDEEAREAERLEKETRKSEKEARKNPLKEIGGGVKQATYGSASGLVSDTADGAADGAVAGTLEGARKGTGTVLDNTIKGTVKVATLGYGHVDHYEVEEPEAGSGEPTKIKFKIPGT